MVQTIFRPFFALIFKRIVDATKIYLNINSFKHNNGTIEVTKGGCKRHFSQHKHMTF